MSSASEVGIKQLGVLLLAGSVLWRRQLPGKIQVVNPSRPASPTVENRWDRSQLAGQTDFTY